MESVEPGAHRNKWKDKNLPYTVIMEEIYFQNVELFAVGRSTSMHGSWLRMERPFPTLRQLVVLHRYTAKSVVRKSVKNRL